MAGLRSFRPSYCRDAATGRAYVKLNGERIYLGKYNSPESRIAYEQTIDEWAGRRRFTPPPPRSDYEDEENKRGFFSWRQPSPAFPEPVPRRDEISQEFADADDAYEQNEVDPPRSTPQSTATPRGFIESRPARMAADPSQPRQAAPERREIASMPLTERRQAVGPNETAQPRESIPRSQVEPVMRADPAPTVRPRQPAQPQERVMRDNLENGDNLRPIHEPDPQPTVHGDHSENGKQTPWQQESDSRPVHGESAREPVGLAEMAPLIEALSLSQARTDSEYAASIATQPMAPTAVGQMHDLAEADESMIRSPAPVQARLEALAADLVDELEQASSAGPVPIEAVEPQRGLAAELEAQPAASVEAPAAVAPESLVESPPVELDPRDGVVETTAPPAVEAEPPVNPKEASGDESPAPQFTAHFSVTPIEGLDGESITPPFEIAQSIPQHAVEVLASSYTQTCVPPMQERAETQLTANASMLSGAAQPEAIAPPSDVARMAVPDSPTSMPLLPMLGTRKPDGSAATSPKGTVETEPFVDAQAQAVARLKAISQERAIREANAMAQASPATEPQAQVKPPAPKPPAGPALPPILLGQGVGEPSVRVEVTIEELCRPFAFLGATGSGKTTAGLALVESLLLRGIPAILVDRKGDLARYADPSAWTPRADPIQAQHLKRVQSAIDVVLYTPGSPMGRPLGVPVVPDGIRQLTGAEREQTAQLAAASIGGLAGYRTARIDALLLRILSKAIEVLADASDQPITLEDLRQRIVTQDAALLRALGGGHDAKEFAKLAADLQTLALHQKRLLSSTAEPLDIDALLGRGASAVPGKTRLSIINTGSLGSAVAVEFWVSQLFLALDRWRSKTAADTLQAVVFLDEADQYLPALRQPTTKAPLESLLRHSHAAGLGLILAAQSSGDFDYKCKESIHAWLVGRVKEPAALTKLKPMFSETTQNVMSKLAAQKTGDFFLLRGQSAIAFQSTRSAIDPKPLAEQRIAELARAKR